MAWQRLGLADLFPAASAPEALADPVRPSPPASPEAGAAGRPLRVKLGIDPTGSDIHLGHSIGTRILVMLASEKERRRSSCHSSLLLQQLAAHQPEHGSPEKMPPTLKSQLEVQG